MISFYVKGQSSPKQITHITKQTQVTSLVTLCDIYCGKLSKEEIMANPYLMVNNNKVQWRIISYDFTFSAKGVTNYFNQSNEKFSQESLDKLSTASKGGRLFIDYIKAVNKYNDTCYLNPIVIKIATD